MRGKGKEGPDEGIVSTLTSILTLSLVLALTLTLTGARAVLSEYGRGQAKLKPTNQQLSVYGIYGYVWVDGCGWMRMGVCVYVWVYWCLGVRV